MKDKKRHKKREKKSKKRNKSMKKKKLNQSKKKKSMTEKSKDKKRKNKKGVKGKKNKRKNQKGKHKKGRKEMNRSSKNSKNYMRYGNSTISSQCFEAVQTAFKRRVTAFNFDNQRKRVEKQTKLVVNKFKKREEFGIVAQKLIKLGGGKKDNLTCVGSTTSSEALKLQNTTLSLLKCGDNITYFCKTVFPSYNVTLVNECIPLSEKFKNITYGCSNKADQTESCKCWTSNIQLIENIKKCKIEERLKIASATEDCRKAFMVCRKLEDASIQSFYECQAPPCCLCPCPFCTPESKVKTCNNEIKETNIKITIAIKQKNTANGASKTIIKINIKLTSVGRKKRQQPDIDIDIDLDLEKLDRK